MLKEPESASPRLPLAITAVVDSRRLVANGGTTVDNDLKVSGTGTESAVVALFDGGVDTNKTTSVNALGNWDIPVTVVLGPHSYTVREEPGDDSPPWLITVVTEVKPVITSIKDAAGNVIPNGGSIEDNSAITIYGTASIKQEVELFDFTQSAGPVQVDDNGEWKFQAWGLQYKQYSVTAKALYGGDQVSDPWVFTVMVATVPTIDSVTDSTGAEIPPNGTTFSTSVTLSGTAAANQDVQILDGVTELGKVRTTIVGGWTLPLTGLTAKAYSIRARGLYGSNPESAVWGLTVKSFSGVEDFEAEVPRDIPFRPETLFRSGLYLVGTHFPPGDVRIVRAGSEQGEHGFQSLVLGRQPSFVLSVRGKFLKMIEFTAWSSTDAPGVLPPYSSYFYVTCHYSDGTYSHHSPDFFAGVKILLSFSAPPSKSITFIELIKNLVLNTGSVSCDSFRWIEEGDA